MQLATGKGGPPPGARCRYARQTPLFCPWNRSRPRLVGGGDSDPSMRECVRFRLWWAFYPGFEKPIILGRILRARRL